MGLKTRLDGRSKDNNLLLVKDSQGTVVAEIKATDSGVNLEVSTYEGHVVAKPNGWSSEKKD